MYMSFKVGDQEELRDGRRFSDYTEQSLRDLIGRHADLAVVRIWQTDDMRRRPGGPSWLNALVRNKRA
jgi:hypothetical protein